MAYGLCFPYMSSCLFSRSDGLNNTGPLNKMFVTPFQLIVSNGIPVDIFHALFMFSLTTAPSVITLIVPY